jgi:hypothetical protein
MVTALRHTGFFQDGIMYRDQRVEMFLPMKMLFEGQRQRFVIFWNVIASHSLADWTDWERICSKSMRTLVF